MSKRLTQKEVEQRIKSTFIQPVEVGQYINKRTPIHLKCLVCNFEWDAVTASVLYRNNHIENERHGDELYGWDRHLLPPPV